MIEAFLSALQLSDSGFPSGRDTLSYGLESFAHSEELTRPDDLLRDSIRFAVAPSDGVALACAHRATDPAGSVDLDLVTRADERLTAVRLARESREASTRTGRALLSAATAAFGTKALSPYAERVREGLSPGNHAVVLGVLSAALDVPRVDAVAAELYAFSAGWVAAAVRLSLIDHLAAQRLLHQVRPVTAAAAVKAAGRDVADISSCTPLLDVMSMRHEHAELRLFAS